MNLVVESYLSNGAISESIEINITDKELSLEELIAKKVKAQIDKNLQANSSEKERLLNQKKEKIDFETEFFKALDGFSKNKYFVLVDNKQISSLDEKLKLADNSKVNFLKLTPLTGG